MTIIDDSMKVRVLEKGNRCHILNHTKVVSMNSKIDTVVPKTIYNIHIYEFDTNELLSYLL